MRLLPFKKSELFTIGTELEFQIIDPESYNLCNAAKSLMKPIKKSPYSLTIKPEGLQTMIEINSEIHKDTNQLLNNLTHMRNYLALQASQFNILFCGGGSHPFQSWISQKIFPADRFIKIAKQYRYLAKNNVMFFGQHIHIGCTNGDDAIYLIHALARYVPHLIAISASSPYYEGVDTGYDSARVTIFNDFPTCGVMPYLTSWKDFSIYFKQMRHLEVIESIKDLYWDIRPQPKFGSIEIRICDTPLSIKTAVLITAYVQTLAAYLLTERPIKLHENLYQFYKHNRFQAARHGLLGTLIDPATLKPIIIRDDILETLKLIHGYSLALNNQNFINKLKKRVFNNQNDAALLRNYYLQYKSLHKLIKKECAIWKEPINKN